MITLITLCALPSLAQETSLKTLDFFVGEWSLITTGTQPDGSLVKGKARSKVKYILDGHAIEDDYYDLNENGDVVFRGISIRSYNRNTKRFQIVWVMPGVKGITDIDAEWKDGKLVSTGKGYDGYGEFLERFEYYDITKDTYKFKMDRSYDGGNHWIENFSRIEAKRVK